MIGSWQVLDVACGQTPSKHADVCGDLYLTTTLHRDSKTGLTPQKYPNFVRFDATCLPFRDNAFDMITAYAILEHLPEPLKALKEWKRVAPRLMLTVPERSDEFLACNPMHLYSWSAPSLEHFLKLVYSCVEIRQRRYAIQWFKRGKMPAMMNMVLRNFLSKLWLFRREELIGIAQ